MRIRSLQLQRETERKQFQDQINRMQQETERGLVSMSNKFSGNNDSLEEQLKARTVGLVTLEDFRRKRESLQMKSEMDALEKQRERKTKQTRVVSSKLSFDVDEENTEEAEDSSANSASTTNTAATSTSTASATELPQPREKKQKQQEQESSQQPDEDVTGTSEKKKKMLKNPFVDTAFLPDRERELKEQQERELLATEWKEKQELIKSEQINVTYSYWDGSGHRRSATVTKGTTIGRFLDLIKQEFKDLRGVSVDNLMFIKEDLIIPQHYSFYELILSKARGKSGPLFHFDVHEDIRMMSDASVEKDESHAGKVVERRWYERNKHIFPASRWEVFDANIKRDGTYTIHDRLAIH